jgi:hypothetical protein
MPLGSYTVGSTLGPVLVVEDPFVRSYIRSLLVRQGLTVVEGDVASGLEILRSHEPAVAMIVTNTPAAFAHVASELPLIYVAAFPDETLAAPYSRWRALRKPFPPEQLRSALRELLDCTATAAS